MIASGRITLGGNASTAAEFVQDAAYIRSRFVKALDCYSSIDDSIEFSTLIY